MFKPASELTLFEACNKLCFFEDLKIAHKINETLSFPSGKFSEYFTDFRLVFLASDFEHKFFTSFDLLMNSLGGLEFFDEFSRKCRAFKILIRA
jgi:hypothetical protein